MVAQQLYEGIELPARAPVGLITYMRTDSTRVSDQALTEVREYIARRYGADYVPEKPNYYKAKADAQDAHEAIRPTSMQYDPETVRAYPDAGSATLYRLIWKRFVASQMPPAVFDDTTVDIAAAATICSARRARCRSSPAGCASTSRTRGSDSTRRSRSDAGASRDGRGCGAGVLPPLAEGETLELLELKPEQKFTQPPPRFNEATLVKALEENGIGRPTTYAQIISVLQAREYVNKIEGRFMPTSSASCSSRAARRASPTSSTSSTRRAGGRARRDRGGQADYASTLTELLQDVREGPEARRQGDAQRQGRAGRPTIVCDKCGAPMVIKAGRFGNFLACAAIRSARTRASSSRRTSSREDLDESVRELRPPDGREARPLRQVPRLHRISGVQDDAQAHPTSRGRPRRSRIRCSTRSARSAGRTSCIKHGTLRRVHRLQQLSRVRVREAEVHRRAVPKSTAATSSSGSPGAASVFYGCANYPDCEFTLWNKPIAETVPEVRRAVPRREDHQAARPPARLRERGSATRPVARSWRAR